MVTVRGLDIGIHADMTVFSSLSALVYNDERRAWERYKREVETRVGSKTMKRNLFEELNEGFDALAEQRHGKRTLRTHSVETRPVSDMQAAELVALRERLHLSRAVFARYLRTNLRTLENWEQGRAKPNAQAALLIRLVAHYPETLAQLDQI